MKSKTGEAALVEHYLYLGNNAYTSIFSPNLSSDDITLNHMKTKILATVS